ncbi:NAD-dependent epimerase/dehydratase family protein [Methylomonas sp. MgM2]
MASNNKQLILITGASGNIGSTLSRAFTKRFQVVGLDRTPSETEGSGSDLECDLTSDDSVKLALYKIKDRYGDKIAAVIHLAAYFDFSGEEHPLYQSVTVDGTRRLLKYLSDFQVERFIYSSTMLVHEPGAPGRKINEDAPLKPKWAYPRSKVAAEQQVRQHCGDTPYTILRLAGLYGDDSAVPTLAYQIARIYERDFKSHLYAGDLMAGQAFLHKDDLVELFLRVVECRSDLPKQSVILAGEGEVMGYQALQNRIGYLIFGEERWSTVSLPELVAKPGAWLEDRAEPLVPDAFDQGQKPFIKPFMIDLASDHYDLDIERARRLLNWTPKHKIYDGLEQLVLSLKSDPAAWYRRNGITLPDWMKTAEEKNRNPHQLRERHEIEYRAQHRQNLWAHFFNMGLACWLIASPITLGYESRNLFWSDIGSGIVLFILSFVSLSWHWGFVRWLAGTVGLWLLSAPLIFLAPTAAAYLNDTLIGMLAVGFAVLTRPVPGVAAVAAETGPTVPPGWTFSPSTWFQRMPIIFLAFIGFFISRYLCSYQLGHIDGVWEPFFFGSPHDPKNGTEEIITSYVSRAWPVPDAGLGAMTYALEILTGVIGSSRRWRTMPWLVVLFGIMIVPLGAVSIFFIIIQPILLGTWCTLCLIAAAAMLIQIPYSLDELVATGEFLYRRRKQGRPLLRIFFTGDSDDGEWQEKEDDFEQSTGTVVREMFSGGVSLPWSLTLCMPIGVWLMFTRLTLGAEAGMADADHLIGSLVLAVAVTALAETGRAIRFLLIPLGSALLITPFVYGADVASVLGSVACGVLLIGLSFPRGPVYNSYGLWGKAIV